MNTPSNEPQTKQENMMPRWRFANRWRIEGCLVTLTSLHVGNGHNVHHPDLEVDGKLVDIQGHTVDGNGLPCIHGSALKGSLRRLAEPDSPLEKIVGAPPKSGDDKKTQASIGGIAEFHDAHLVVFRTRPTPLPYWDESRQMWVETTNSIDRHTRTAAEQHLMHAQMVPPGVGFDVVITGAFEDDHQVACLLAALERFNDKEQPLTLGADTAGGLGRVRWEPGRIRMMDASAVLAWINKTDRKIAGEEMPLLEDSRAEAIAKKAGLIRFPRPEVPHWVNMKITLKFNSHFLVNDPPSQREIDEAGDPKRVPAHRTRVDEKGRVLLPAKSFRGAFRSQAERILRTMGIFACDPSDPSRTDGCKKDITDKKATNDLCLACQIFGASGWKTTIAIDDFLLAPGNYDCGVQEFLAIDRFTGGGKAGAKFNAQAIYQPVLKGAIRLDVDRIPVEGLGLIALTLRDLMEGDITFGFGAAKGYGTCTAEVSVWNDQLFKEKTRASLVELRKHLHDTVERRNR